MPNMSIINRQFASRELNHVHAWPQDRCTRGTARGQDPLPLANRETKLGTRRALTWELPGTLPAPVPLNTEYFDVRLPRSVI
jgi:hypothetical protein